MQLTNDNTFTLSEFCVPRPIIPNVWYQCDANGIIEDLKIKKGDVVDQKVSVDGFVKKDGDWHHYAKVGDKEYVDGKEFEGANSFMPLYHKPTKYVVAMRDCYFGVSTVNMWTNSKKKAKQFAKQHKGAVVYRATRKNK